jgi:hypothetical protein
VQDSWLFLVDMVPFEVLVLVDSAKAMAGAHLTGPTYGDEIGFKCCPNVVHVFHLKSWAGRRLGGRNV